MSFEVSLLNAYTCMSFNVISVFVASREIRRAAGSAKPGSGVRSIMVAYFLSVMHGAVHV